jgi:hypothetical protein
MPRLIAIHDAALSALLDKQHGILTRSQARSCGLSSRAIDYRLRETGPWQVLLPGVYQTWTGQAGPAQQQIAALLYAGPASMITGLSALSAYGVKVSHTELIDVLVPARRQRASHAFARLHRTARLPAEVYTSGVIRYAPPPRAVADAARGMARIADVRAVVADAVQRGRCPLEMLVAEVGAGPVRGSALLRQTVAEVTGGVRSVVEAEFRDLIIWAGLPMPLFNPRLSAGGRFIAQPDCWWPDAAVAAEVDSREWHLSPQDWERTLARHALMSSHGIVVLHFTPRQIRGQRAQVAANLRAALEAAANRPVLPIAAASPG